MKNEHTRAHAALDTHWLRQNEFMYVNHLLLVSIAAEYLHRPFPKWVDTHFQSHLILSMEKIFLSLFFSFPGLGQGAPVSASPHILTHHVMGCVSEPLCLRALTASPWTASLCTAGWASLNSFNKMPV